jgi:hypothetical protein
VNVLRTPEQLPWVGKLVAHVIASKAGGHDKRSSAVARWLANRIGEGGLPSASDSTNREALRTSWREIFDALPAAWLIDAPVATQEAVAELAREGLLGEGLLPIPFGRRPESLGTLHPEPERLDRALLGLGKLLVAGHEGTQSTQRLGFCSPKPCSPCVETGPWAKNSVRCPYFAHTSSPRRRTSRGP